MSEAPPLGLASGTVRLVPHDPRWPAAFAEAAARIRGALGALPAVVEHVGSTAVPGLAAKPILDVLIGRPADGPLAPYVAALVGLGHAHRGEHGIPGREYFVRDDAAGLRTHHVHLVALGSDLWVRHLAFRDRLRGDPARAAEYAALKRALAAAHPGDRDRYVRGKTRFIEATLAGTGMAGA